VKLILVVFIGLSLGSFSQVLDNRKGEAFTDKPFFNEEFVRANKLKKLKGEFQYMKHGDGLRSTDFEYVYEFDDQGRLISTFETRTDDGSIDTTWQKYDYNDNDRVVKFSKTDMEGFQTINYTRDSLGRVLTEEFARDVDSAGVVVRSLTFNKESIKYFDYDMQTKRTRYNNYDLPYLDEYFNYNELGYLVERIERIKMTGTVYTFSYEYNREGKLSAIRKKSNKEEGYLEELLYKYDELGNLIEKHIYKKGVFTTDIQIMYSSKTKLLSTVLTREVATDFMMILRFRDYEFFE
jgi:hypothetical protein